MSRQNGQLVRTSDSAVSAGAGQRNCVYRVSWSTNRLSHAMALRAMAAPMETPTPAAPPADAEADTAPTVAAMVVELTALTATAPALLMVLLSMKALVPVSTVLRAKAPAPEPVYGAG